MKQFLLVAIVLTSYLAQAQQDSTNSDCKAAFKYEFNTKLMGPMPHTAVNFYDVSEGEVNAWFWDFGDGETSREQHPLHVYQRPVVAPNVKINPYRQVVLTVLTADSCKSQYMDTINIMQEVEYEEPTCKAAFKYYQAAYDSTSGMALIQFNNYSTGDSLSYFWQINEDITSTEKEPKIQLSTNQREHEVCLTVYGPDSCSDIFCDVVYVENPNDSVQTPEECFTAFGYKINYDIRTFAPALVLDFYSKADPEAVAWFWDFDDGTTSNEEFPTHIFNYPVIGDSVLGDPNPFRKVCLTVVTADGCKASYCETINVYMNDSTYTEPIEKCEARFKYYKPDIITIPEVVPFEFNNASEGDVVRLLWEFEDGSSSTENDVQINFDIFKSTQKVCLTIFTADSCSSTYCETVYVSKPYTDSLVVDRSKYHMRYESYYPPEMSSCNGYVKAQVYYGDSLVNAEHYKWSHGAEGQEAKGFCPTQGYSVKAKTADGNIVSGTFVFNSDGTVTEKPVYWWVSGELENEVVRLDVAKKGYFVEWKLCDGTTIKADSVKLELINCNTEGSNLILKDSLGNVVYSDNVSKQSMATAVEAMEQNHGITLFPNPVNDVLNINYFGDALREIQVEIFNITGRSVLVEKIQNVENAQSIGLNVYNLKSGIYLCKVSAENRVIATKKFTK